MADVQIPSEFFMTINGQKVKASKTIDVYNPSTGQVFAQAPDCSKEDVDAAVQAAKKAFSTFKNVPIEKRKEYLKLIIAGIQKRAAQLAKVLTLEQGKSLKNATGEIQYCNYFLNAFTEQDIPVEVVVDNENERAEIHYRPLGVIGAICPWNFPAVICIQKVGPAILTGNTVVLKPSPFTPLTTLLLGEIFSEVLPAGVVNIISGGNDSGAWLTQHKDVAKISFTGSVRTGKIIKSVCAEDLKRVTLELGGNDAAIVRQDCDVEQVVPQIFGYAFANSGQVCCAIKRVYVHESKYDDFCKAMVEECKKHKFGDGLDPDTEFGPVNNKMQYDRVQELVKDAMDHGAKVMCGGLPPANNKGYLLQPTILTNVSDGLRIVDEEQFGPVLPIMSYKDDQEAVQRANNSNFGLGGSVWSKDISTAAQLAGQLECGSAWCNQHLQVLPHLPFGGFKHSGYGREGGKWGLSHLLEPQCVHIKKNAKL